MVPASGAASPPPAPEAKAIQAVEVEIQSRLLGTGSMNLSHMQGE
jgi:hypothetical protein